MSSIHAPRAVVTLAVALGCVLVSAAGAHAAPIVQQFSPVGSEQTFTVPANVTSVQVDAVGAGGGSDGKQNLGGAGGTASAELAVTAGEVLYVEVGGTGGAPGTAPGSGGFNGGGAGGAGQSNAGPAAGGGGDSDVQSVSSTLGTPGLSSLLVVAGGGGGAAADVGGGAGGGLSGAMSPSGQSTLGGGGGTQTAGGAGATNQPQTNGAFDAGGAGLTGVSNGGGGGGGGGLYGGGGGTSLVGGGGGSGYFGTGTSGGTFGTASAGASVTLTYVVNPTITVTTPAAGATFTQNEPVDAAYTCNPAPGTTMAACQSATAPGAAIDTSSLGQHSLTVTATDADAADGGGSTTTTVTYTVEAAPTATIATPGSGMYSQNTIVDAAYSCAAASTTTIAACTGTVSNGAPINTATLGPQSFTVTATDATGNSTTSTVRYDVIPAPTVQVRTPANGAAYAQHAVIDASFACISAATVTCTGTSPVGAAIDTATPGPHSFTVTARDAAGGSATQTVSYTVTPSGPARPPERITLLTKTARLTSQHRFSFTLTTSPPTGGTITFSSVRTVTVRHGRHRVRKRVTISFKASFAAGQKGSSTVLLTLPRSLRAHFHGLTLTVTVAAGGGSATGSLRLKPPVAKRRR